MANNIKVNYGGVDLFDGVAPTPFIYSNQEFIDYKNKWNQITNLIMEGQLTGKYLGELSHGELITSFKTLLSRLKNNFQELTITEDNQTIFSANKVIFDNIDVPESRWYGVLPFTINFTVYQENLFTNYYGVLDPVNILNFKEEENEILSLTHDISAKGFITNGKTAIQNAKDWVSQRTGSYNNIVPILIQNNQNGSNFILESINETIDRFNSEYSWQAVYTKSNSSESPKNCFLNYTLDISSGIDNGYINVDIKGSLEKNSLNILRTEYDSLNLYNLANTAANQSFKVSLNTKPISKSVSESADNNILNFSASFNNDLSPDIIHEYNVDINEDSIKNIATVNLSSKIRAKYGDVSARWTKVQQFYNTNFNPFNIVNTEYKKEISNKTLFSNKLTESITFDEFNAEINYNASWSDKKQSYSQDVLNLSSTVSYRPSINIYIPQTSIKVAKEHNVQNIKCANRAVLNISVSAASKPNNLFSIDLAKNVVNSELNRIKSAYGQTSRPSLLQERTENINKDLKSFSVNEVWLIEGVIYGP